MPSKKTTKNGVDLNQIDVSNLTLVDKEDLLDDLSKKLTTKIHQVFQQATENAAEDLADMLKDGNVSSGGGGGSAPRNSSSGGGGSRPRSPRKSTGGNNNDDDFEKIRQVEASTKKVVDQLTALQKKKDKEKLIKQRRGNVYSDAGKRHAENIDSMASEYHTYSKDELEGAKKKLSDIQESVRFSTVGTENKILTNATLNLQKALEQETRQRTGLLGKMGSFLQKQNIDAVSVISGLAGHSPIVGLATKYILEKMRDRREARQKTKANQFKVGDIKKVLPRPDEPMLDDADVKHDHDTVKEHLGKIKDEDVRHSALENLHAKGKISTEQHQNLRAELLRPDYQPLWERAAGSQGQSTPVSQSPLQTIGSTSPTAVAHGPSVSSAPQQLVRDHLGNAIPDWAGYQKSTPKKQQELDERDAWLESIRKHGKGLLQKKHEDSLKKPSGTPDWPEIFGEESHPKPTALAHMEKQEAERMKNPYNSPVKAMMTAAVHAMPNVEKFEAPPQLKKAAAPELVQNGRMDLDEPTLHPEKLASQSNTAGLLKLMEGVQKDQDKKLSILTSDKEGPLSRVAKLDEEQLIELKEINKLLAKQLDQSELDANAKRRETTDGDAGGLLADVAKKSGGKKGGLLGGLMSGIEAGIGRLFGGKIGKWLGLGNKTAKGGAEAEEGGMFKRWFGRGKGASGAGRGVEGAASGIEAVEDGAKGLGEVGKAVGEGAEAGAKGGTKLLAEGGEMLKGAKLLGGAGRMAEFLDFIPVVGEVIMAITAIFDFIPAFMHAEKYLGDKKKLTMMDRVAGGLGGVVEGLFGIIDFVLGLAGVKTEIGKTLGKTSAKSFASIFKAIGSILSALYVASKPIFKVLGPILEFVAKRLGKMIEIIGDFFEGLSKFIDGLSDLSDPKTFDKGIEELKDGVLGMFSALGKWFLTMFNLDTIKDALDKVIEAFTKSFENFGQEIMKIPGMETITKAFASISTAFSSVFDSIKKMVENIIGPQNTKILTDALQSVTDAIKSVIDWISDKINSILHPFGGGKKTAETAKPAPTTSAPAPSAAPAPTQQTQNTVTPRRGLNPPPATPISSTPELAKTARSFHTPTTSPTQTKTVAPTSSPTSPTPATPQPQSSGVTAAGGSGIGILGTGGGTQNKNIKYKQGEVPPEIAQMAMDAEKATGVPAQVTIAQWAVESGWGKHSIGNNAFGVTKSKSDTMSQTRTTQEDMTPAEFAQFQKSKPKEAATATELDGSPLKMGWSGKKRFSVKREFADYKTMEEGFIAHAKLLSNPKGPYAAAFAEYQKTGDVNKFIENMGAKYATARGYGDTIKNVANQKNVVTALSRSPKPVDRPTATSMPAMVATATNTAAPRLDTPKLSPESTGVQLAQVSAVNSELNRTSGQSGTGHQIIAPQTTKITNNNSTHTGDLRAKNTDTSYERNQNAMFIPT
jgi:hypothetical protein